MGGSGGGGGGGGGGGARTSITFRVSMAHPTAGILVSSRHRWLRVIGGWVIELDVVQKGALARRRYGRTRPQAAAMRSIDVDGVACWVGVAAGLAFRHVREWLTSAGGTQAMLVIPAPTAHIHVLCAPRAAGPCSSLSKGARVVAKDTRERWTSGGREGVIRRAATYLWTVPTVGAVSRADPSTRQRVYFVHDEGLVDRIQRIHEMYMGSEGREWKIRVSYRMDLVHLTHLEPTHRAIHWIHSTTSINSPLTVPYTGSTVLPLSIAHLCAVDHVEPTLVGIAVRCHPSEDRRSIAVDECPSL
jgi:hypothetical protein